MSAQPAKPLPSGNQPANQLSTSDAPSRRSSGMAVYTELTKSELDAFIALYQLGHVVNFEGVTAGVENTNYRLTLDDKGQQSTLFLTLFEMHDADEAPYFVDLVAHLGTQGLPVARPIASKDNQYLGRLKHKPAVLVPCIEGEHPSDPSLPQCEAIGAFLAQMHRAGRDFAHSKHNPRGHQWWYTVGHELANKLNAFDASVMLDELEYLKEHWPKNTSIPFGVVHADLFTDNAFFSGDQLTGVIDFYNACDDFLLYDLAITVLAWCSRDDHLLDKYKMKALIKGYESVRPISALEETLWPTMLRAAAMRFWCSRLISWLEYQEHPIPGLKPLNPDEMKQALLDKQRHSYPIR